MGGYHLPRPPNQQVEKVASAQACQCQSRINEATPVPVGHAGKSYGARTTPEGREGTLWRGGDHLRLGTRRADFPLTLASQSHSSCLPQFIHFTSGSKILHSQRQITEEVCLNENKSLV